MDEKSENGAAAACSDFGTEETSIIPLEIQTEPVCFFQNKGFYFFLNFASSADEPGNAFNLSFN